MLKALRCALVALATVSSILFATPASAGMVSTPKQDAAEVQREAAKELLKCRLAESGVSPAVLESKLDRLSTQELVLLTGHVEATRSAGGVALAIGIAVAVVIVVVLILFETFYPEH